tara:strand:- start:3035 stop:3868 length:834 start_codon:yes stop_codon:yes gene_type:complete
MLILNTINDCKNWRANQKSSVGFVPTMGALHQGHLSLIQKSKKHCSKTIVSIYINPTQFAENEDLSSYPKTITEDLNNLKKLKTDAVFLPTDEEMYPNMETEGFNYESPLFTKLEGKSRPHFFYGVTKIVSRLFNLVQPSHAFFGEKDAQQSRIIKQMVADLNYNIIIVSCPTVRDKKGLALSSRNQYLSKAEQTKASIIYQSLIVIKQLIQGGQKDVQALKKAFILSVNGCSGFTVDYISVACNESLKELDVWRPESLISTAVFYKDVRLIDNLVY